MTDKTSQGIVRDNRGQEQPADKAVRNSGHGRASRLRSALRQKAHEPPTELEQCPSELIGNFTGIDKEVFLEKRVYHARSIK